MPLSAHLGPLTGDQEALIPAIDRAITACVRGTLIREDGSAAKAVASILYWLENGPQSGRIDLDFPRRHELAAVCAVETHVRYLRHANDQIVRRAASQLVA
jgi:hypothetical protein